MWIDKESAEGVGPLVQSRDAAARLSPPLEGYRLISNGLGFGELPGP